MLFELRLRGTANRSRLLIGGFLANELGGVALVRLRTGKGDRGAARAGVGFCTGKKCSRQPDKNTMYCFFHDHRFYQLMAQDT